MGIERRRKRRRRSDLSCVSTQTKCRDGMRPTPNRSTESKKLTPQTLLLVANPCIRSTEHIHSAWTIFKMAKIPSCTLLDFQLPTAFHLSRVEVDRDG